MKRLIALVGLGILAWGIPAYSADSAPSIELNQPIRNEGKPISLNVKDASADQVLSTLSASVGSPMRLNGVIDKKITMKFVDLPASQAIDQVATELGCKWQRHYTLFKKTGAGDSTTARRPSGKKVSIEVSEMNLQVVAKMIVRAASGVVQIQDGLSGKVNLNAQNMPVEEALDTICSPVGADWKVEFVLTPSLEAKAAAKEKPASSAEPEPAKVEPAQTPEVNKEPITKVISKSKPRFVTKTSEPVDNNKSGQGIPRGPHAFPNPAPITDFFGMGGSADQALARMTKQTEKLLAASQAQRQKTIQDLSSRITEVWEYVCEEDQETMTRFLNTAGPGIKAFGSLVPSLDTDKQVILKPITDSISPIMTTISKNSKKK